MRGGVGRKQWQTAPLLAEELERTLLRLVASLHQVLQRLLAERMLTLGDDAALVLHQVLLHQAAGRVTSRAVPHLRLGADGRLGATHHTRLHPPLLLAAAVAAAATTLHRGNGRHGHGLRGHLSTTHALTASATAATTAAPTT
jgi:hypothetical protein